MECNKLTEALSINYLRHKDFLKYRYFNNFWLSFRSQKRKSPQKIKQLVFLDKLCLQSISFAEIQSFLDFVLLKVWMYPINF